jgi:2-polyprenyl-3-methyl-5-hydroxy-6-metoxy-1,4-benzoquinol methylase
VSRFSLYNRAVRRIDDAAPPDPAAICPVCGVGSPERRFAVESLTAEVLACGACGLGWLHPQPSPAEVGTFYPPEYYGSTGRKFVGLVEFFVRWVSRRRVRFLARHVPACGRVLDVGCGRGTLLGELADLGYETHGFEISAAAAEGADSRVSIRVGARLAAAGYPEQWFDQVIIWHVLEHVADPRATLAEIHRVLKPGGEVVVAVPNFSSWQARWSDAGWFHLDLPRHLYHFSRESLRRLLCETGFEVRSEHHFSLRQNPFGWVQSTLNRWPRSPRNGLYELLHNRRTGEPPPFTACTRFWLKFAFLAGMFPATLLEMLAALFRTGATVHFVARKPLTQGDCNSRTIGPGAIDSEKAALSQDPRRDNVRGRAI